MGKKIKTVLLLRDALFNFVEKQTFDSRKEAMEYAIRMHNERKASMCAFVKEENYSPYFDYKYKFISTLK